MRQPPTKVIVSAGALTALVLVVVTSLDGKPEAVLAPVSFGDVDATTVDQPALLTAQSVPEGSSAVEGIKEHVGSSAAPRWTPGPGLMFYRISDS